MSGSKRRETSDIWKYFTKISDSATNALCKFCNASISRGGKNATIKGFTTSNLWNHIKRFHNEEIGKNVSSQVDCGGGSLPKRQATLPEMFESSKKYNVDDPRAMEITRLIAEEICLDMEPLNHVNKKGFQRVIKKLCPRYEMVSRTHISQTVLPDMYERVKFKIKLELNSMIYLCITSDLWSSDSSSNINDFISLTAHGLDENFQLKNVCLEVMPFDGESHSAELISQNLSKAIKDWDIVGKVKIIITDNARNIVNAVKKMPNIDHFPCLAHSLQLVLHDAVFEHNDVKDMVNIARKIVGHFSHSTKADKILRAAQEAHNVSAHILIQDVPTRWDSTYLMLQRLNEQRVAIQAVMPKLNVSCDLNTQQWILLQQVVDILKYFAEVTKALSKDEATLADAIPLVNSLFKVLEEVPSEPQCVRFMAESLKLKLTERLGMLEENENCILATALDPRYKLRVFRLQTTNIKTRELLYSAIEQTSEKDEHQNEATSSRPTASTSTSSGIWNICQQIIDNVESDEPLAIYAGDSRYKTEVDSYLTSSNIPHSSDIFSYWKNCYTFPLLKKLALKFFSYKPTSVNSERLFSTAGLVQTPKRNRLSPLNLQMLCFFNKNLPAINFDY